jgi:hypothetical protein
MMRRLATSPWWDGFEDAAEFVEFVENSAAAALVANAVDEIDKESDEEDDADKGAAPLPAPPPAALEVTG